MTGLLKIIQGFGTRAGNAGATLTRWVGNGFRTVASRTGLNQAGRANAGGRITKRWFTETGARYPFLKGALSVVYSVGELLFVWTAFNFAVDTVAGMVKALFGAGEEGAQRVAFWIVGGATLYLAFIAMRRLLK